MRLRQRIVQIDLGGIPAVGDLDTGSMVGLTPSGAALCDRMLHEDADPSEVPEDCRALIDHLGKHGYLVGIGPSNVEPRPIRSAYLHVTDRCDLSCIGCYSASPSRNVREDPSIGDLLRAVDVLASLGVERLVISGGEPFLRHDLSVIAERAMVLGMSYITVVTNGLHICTERLKDLAGMVDLVCVSFDAASESDESAVRGVRRFDLLCRAVGLVRVLGLRAQVLATIHAGNIQDAPRFMALARELDAEVGFSLLSGASGLIGDLLPTEGDLSDLARIMIGCGVTADVEERDGDRSKGSWLHARDRCGAARTSVSVAADGSVYPCHMLMRPEFRLGNAFTDETGVIRQAINDFQMPGVDEIGQCSPCSRRYICGGGCRARAYLARGALERGGSLLQVLP